MSDKQETIEILVIKQDDKPIRKTIPNTLEAKQHEVGGYIEPYGLKNGATIYCNEEGKLGSWSLNRAIRACDLDDRAGSQIVEMMAGTFFISGFDPESGEDTSLTEEQFNHWDKRFHSPEIRVQNANNELLAVPVPIK